jgi:hypothetical protein
MKIKEKQSYSFNSEANCGLVNGEGRFWGLWDGKTAVKIRILC